jgi:hypothetical protein
LEQIVLKNAEQTLPNYETQRFDENLKHREFTANTFSHHALKKLIENAVTVGDQFCTSDAAW